MPKPDFDRIERERAQGRKYSAAWTRMLERGLKPVVISRRSNPEAWLRWRDWFRLHGLPMHVALMESHQEHTVPCLDPFDIDLDATARAE